jgi:hypothetical protein
LLKGASPPTRLRGLNYIFFDEDPKVSDSGFGTGLAKLVVALNTDFDWLREHTRYLQRAIEWERGGRPVNRLLSGDDIAEAKAWAARRPKNAPEPTALHLDFMRASEEEAEARSSAQRKQLEAMAAAQAERETALHDREEALKQAADAQRRRARIRNVAFVVVSIFAVLAAGLLWKTLAEQRRFETVFDLLAYHTTEKDKSVIRSAFLLPDRSRVEDQTWLAIATIAAARNIATRDLRNVKILWVDPQAEHNRLEIVDIRDRLRRIGAEIDPSTQVPDALERLKSGLYSVVITNYGNRRCGGKAIAECVLEGVEKLSKRPPVVIYSVDVQPEMADQMKCKGAMASAESPDVLFAWIVRALDSGFAFEPSPQVKKFCTEQKERVKPVSEAPSPRP